MRHLHKVPFPLYVLRALARIVNVQSFVDRMEDNSPLPLEATPAHDKTLYRNYVRKWKILIQEYELVK